MRRLNGLELPTNPGATTTVPQGDRGGTRPPSR